jgi:beta-N-acetylhexosaminidase
MPLALWLALLAMPACAESSTGRLEFSAGGRAEVQPTVEARAQDLVVTAGGLELILKADPAGGYKVEGARWMPGGLRATAVEGNAIQEGGRLQVNVSKMTFEDAAAPVAAALTLLGPAAVDARERERQARVRAMSTSQKIGALLMKPLGPEDLDSHRDDILAGRLGGALLKWDKFTPSEARRFTADLHRLNPNFVTAVDHEAGPVFSQNRQATTFPGSMALGATGDPELTRRAALATARELCGQADMNFGVVADINTNPDNPIIGPRSFGEDPQIVSEHVRAALAGYSETCIAAVIKHFPGHGDTRVDSHIGLPVVAKSLADLERQEFASFLAAIRAGAPSLMTAHIVFPALDPELPATLSKKVIDYLRETMGFQGVLVSDSMDMGAISTKYGAVDASILAVAAGIDVLLMGKQDHVAIHDGLLKAVQEGRLSIDRLDDAVMRILRLKDRNAEKPKTIPDARELAANAALAQEIADKSVTLVRDPVGLIPLKLDAAKTIAVIVSHNGKFGDQTAELVSQIKSRHAKVVAETVGFRPTADEGKRALAAAGKADFLVIGTYHWGAAEVKDQQKLVAELAALGKPVVVVSLMSPYDARFVPGTASVLAVYGFTAPAVRAAVRALFGELAPTGRSPVTIPGGPSAG